MAKLMIAMTVALAMISCTGQKGANNKAKSASSKLLPYEGPIQYTQVTIADVETAAQYDGTPVSWSQLNSNEPALAELEQRWFKKAIAFTNFVAEELVSQGNIPAENLTIQYYFPQPEDPEKLGVFTKDNQQVEFVGFKDPKVIAVVGDKKVLAKDLLSQSLPNLKLYRDLYIQRMRRLNGVIVRRALLKAAKAKNVGIEQFIKSEIITTPITVTPEEVAEFAKQKGIAETDINENVQKKLEAIVKQNRRDLLIENYVAKNLVKKPVEVGFNPPEYNINTPEIADEVPFWGSEEGKPLLYIGHWACENCQEALKFFLNGKDRFASKVKGSFIYFFPDRDREARMSAEAALCIHDQKPEYFWKFVQTSVDSENANSEAVINKAAQDSGADYEAFRKCFLSRKYQQTVDTHLSMVKQMGVFRPPLVVVEGRVFEAPLDEDEISKALSSGAGPHKAQKLGIFGRIKAFIMGLFS